MMDPKNYKMINEKRGLTTIDEKAFEIYKKLMEKQKGEELAEKDDNISLLDLNPEAVSSQMDFLRQLEEGNIAGAGSSLGNFVEGLKELANSLTGDEAESIKTAVIQFGEFSGRMMNFIGGNVSEAPMLTSTPTAEKLAVPAVLTITDAKLVANEVIAQLTGAVAAGSGESAAGAVTNKDLSNEIKDVKATKQDDIVSIKDQLAVLIKLIKEKALTFDDIYKMLARRMARDYEMQTGRRVY